MTHLYLKIIDTVAANRERFVTEGLPVPMVALYAGQPDAPQAFEFTTPAIFVDYRIKWAQGNHNARTGEVVVDIHVLMDPVPGTESFSERRAEGLQKLRFYELVGEVLDGINSETTGTLALTGEEPMQTEYFCYHVLHFTCNTVREKRASQRLTAAKATPKITINGRDI